MRNKKICSVQFLAPSPTKTLPFSLLRFTLRTAQYGHFHLKYAILGKKNFAHAILQNVSSYPSESMAARTFSNSIESDQSNKQEAVPSSTTTARTHARHHHKDQKPSKQWIKTRTFMELFFTFKQHQHSCSNDQTHNTRSTNFIQISTDIYPPDILPPRGRGQEGERGNDEEEEELSIYDPTTVITKEASRWRPLELTLSVTAPSASIARAGGRARQARRGEERRRIIHSFS